MKTPYQVVIRGVLLAAGAALLANGYARVVENAATVGNRWVRHRMSQALAYLDELPPTNSQMIVFLGSSETEIGIDPVQIDEHLREQEHPTFSLDLGLRNMDPSLLHVLTRRIVSSLGAQGKKLGLAVVQFIPQHATKVYAAHYAHDSSQGLADVRAAIYSNPLLLDDFSQRPLDMAEIWLTRNLFSGISPISVSYYSWHVLLQKTSRFLASRRTDQSQHQGAATGPMGNYFGNTELEQVVQNLFKDKKDPLAMKKFLKEKATDFGGLANDKERDHVYTWYGQQIHPEPAWNPEARGGFYFGYPATEDVTAILFKSYRDPQFMEKYLAEKERDLGALSFEFDPELVKAFINSIQELKRCSAQVLLFYLPDAIQREPAAEARLAAALAQIQKGSEVPLLDYTGRPELSADDYFDRIHPNLNGRIKLARMLAQDLPRFLPSTAAPQR